MLLDSKLVNVEVREPGLIIGESRVDDSLLKIDEKIFVAENVQTYVNSVLKHFPDPEHSDSSTDTGRGDFHFFRDWDEAVEVMTKNPQQLVKYEPAELRPTDFMEQGNDLEYDVTGDFIDMGRHMEGIPESFGSLHNGNPRNRRVRILVINSQHAGHLQSKIAHRSERIIRLIDALETANIRCELITVDSQRTMHSECTVKHFDQPLTIEDVAVATNPDFFRRLGFRIIENSDTFEWGYGSPYVLAENMDRFASKLNDELTIFVEGSLNNVDDVFDQLEAEVVEELSKPQPDVVLMKVNSYRVEKVKINEA